MPASEGKQRLEIQQNTRDDYIKRIKDIYDDQSRVVRETQLVMNNKARSRAPFEVQALSVEAQALSDALRGG